MSTVEMENRISRNIDTLLEDGTSVAGQSSCYSGLYKQPGLQNDQESRRSALLQVQKDRRDSVFDQGRPNVNQNDDQKKRIHYNYNYVYRLMFSEWFHEVPEMLETEWYFKLCPIGTRSIVVAKNGETTHYNKNGKYVNQFQSLLPGGHGGKQKYRYNVETILDCVYNKALKIYYVLDVLKWSGKDLTDDQTDFRFFWLQSKFDEEPQLGQHSPNNAFAFIPLTSQPAARESLHQILSTPYSFPVPSIEKSPKIDGVLFYHGETSYQPGFTPLVGWLKCYMFPEILSIPVHETHMLEKPKNYTNLANLIKESQQSKYNWWTNVRQNDPRRNRHRKVEDEQMEDLVGVEKEVHAEMETGPAHFEPFINPDLFKNTFNFKNLTGKK